jgi:hypothetical protein
VASVAPACNASAERQRRYRARQRKPTRTVYQIEVERDATQQALINSSRLSKEIADRDSVAQALSGVIAEWVEHERRRCHP